MVAAALHKWLNVRIVIMAGLNVLQYMPVRMDNIHLHSMNMLSKYDGSSFKSRQLTVAQT